MEYWIASILVLVNLVWLVTAILGLPGIWMMIGSTALVAWWRWDQGMFGLWTLLAILVVGLLAELAEFLAGVLGASRVGGSLWASAAALAGGILGAVAGTFIVPIPLLGALGGACVGAGLCAWAAEMAAGKKMQPSVAAGVGAGIGRLAGTIIKLGAGVLIWLIIAVAAFF